MGSIVVEASACSVSVLLLVLYFWQWSRKLAHNPLPTTRGLMQAARRGWVLSQLNKGIVPIQTMRDFIATARFFASQSLVLCFGVAAYLSGTGSALKLPIEIGAITLMQAKLLLLVGLQCFNFLVFQQCVRYLIHASFLLNARTLEVRAALHEAQQLDVNEQIVWAVLERALFAWAAGLRGTLFTLPLLCWVMSPILLVAATLLLIAILYATDFKRYDHVLPFESIPLVTRTGGEGLRGVQGLESSQGLQGVGPDLELGRGS